MEKDTKEFNPMQFREYSSIENTYRQKEIDTIIQQGKAGGMWRVSEKVHGANISFWYDGKELKCAKRTGFLGEGSNFFNWQDVRMDEQPKIEKLWKYLLETMKVTKHTFKDEADKIQTIEHPIIGIVLYGEIFGGNYPHPDVPRDYCGMTVQKGVYYTPSNLFYCFDIKINGSFINETLKGELCEMFNIFWDKPLFEGTFEECINYKNEYQTTIPGRLRLPDIENNICEGNVIKPIEPAWLWCGSRVILKNKNEKFAEVTKKSSGQKIMKVDKQEVILSEKAIEMLEMLLSYVNENRLRNVLSKMEKVTDHQFGLIVGNFIKDVMEDFLKDHRDNFIVLDIKEQKYIPKRVGNECTILLRRNFLNIIDGTF